MNPVSMGAAGGTAALIFNWAVGTIWPELNMPPEVGAGIAVAAVIPAWQGVSELLSAVWGKLMERVRGGA